MKKLMIAAAAAAMIGGAQAEDANPYNWVQVAMDVEYVTNSVTPLVIETNITSTVELPKTSLVTYKYKKSSQKVFSMNYKDANKKFKAFKTGKIAYNSIVNDMDAGYEREAVDGVIYYGTNGWKYAEWTKDQYKTTGDQWAAPKFTVFGDNIWKPTKASAAYNYSIGHVNGETNAYATVYSKLSVKKGVVDPTIKSVKCLDSDKVTVKNYKDEAACAKALAKLLKKYANSKAKEIK